MARLSILSTLATTALMSLMVSTPVAAAPWWIIAHQQDFCPANDGDTWFNWRGSDSNCHSFANPDNSGTCVFTYVDGTTFKGPGCAPNQADTVVSVHYEDGMDNAGAGCGFFEHDDCTGNVQFFSGLDETDNCQELTLTARSFQCL